MYTANDKQVGGTHYKGDDKNEIQHWDYCWIKKFDPFQYQITKYVERWRRKNGLEDLRKARHFLDKYIELAETEYEGTPKQTEVDAEPGTRYVDQDSSRQARSR